MTAPELLAYIDRSGGRVWLEGGRLKYRLPDGRTDLLEALKAHKDALIGHLGKTVPDGIHAHSSVRLASSVPRLPEALERLVRAASSDALPAGGITLETGIAPDFKTHVLAWGCAYLCGDTDHALERLRVAYRAWVVSRGLN